MSDQPQTQWPGAIYAITLFVEDLAAARAFYSEVFQLPVVFADEASAVFRFGDTLVNLLRAAEAPAAIEPVAVAAPGGGVRSMFTLEVDDVDAACERLGARGAEILAGPVDRPWGIRVAIFRDPGGHLWEIARSTG